MQASLQQAPTILGNYQIVREIKHRTHNRLYIAISLSSNANHPLYLLKIYQTQSGYNREKQVFSLGNLFHNYFIEACDSWLYQDHIFRFTVAQYSNCQSLIELGMLVKQFPFQVAKFYMHDLLVKLKCIHYDHKVPYRTVYASDLIFSEEKRLNIVGWSKMDEKVTEQQAIFDCSQIFYYMLTFGAFQETGLGFKGLQKKRFLSEEFWDLSKRKQNYLKYFPNDKIQLTKLVEFMQAITVRNEQMPITFQKVLADPFFDSVLSFEEASQALTKRELQRMSALKEKDLKNFDIKIKRAKIVNQSFRESDLSQQCEVLKCPFFLKRECISLDRASFTDKIGDLVEKFLITKLHDNLNKNTVFGQDWLKVTQFGIQRKSLDYEVIEYDIVCHVQFVESDDVIPEAEIINFNIKIKIRKQEKGKNCIESYELKMKKNLNQILSMKFEKFICEGLIDSLKYSDD